MQKVYIGNGNYLAPTEEGSVITLGNVQIDCAARQDRAAVIVDLCADGQGSLVEGATSGRAYVASITIPPKIVIEVPQTENGEPVLDDQGNQAYEQVATPLNMDAVIITLWPYTTTNNSQEG
jgi:hypothetical protein